MVRKRPGHRGQHHIAIDVAEIAQIDGNGFGPPEYETGSARQSGHEYERPRDEDRADRVDMRNRIQGNAPQHPGGFVAQLLGSPTVGGLMERNGKNERDGVDANGLNSRGNHVFLTSPGCIDANKKVCHIPAQEESDDRYRL